MLRSQPRRMDLSASLNQILSKGRKTKGSTVQRFFSEFPRETHDELTRTVLALEQSAVASPDPLRALRFYILDFTETWKVTEIIDDIRFEDEENMPLAEGMQEVLSPRYSNIRNPATYFTSKLTSLTLRNYTAANYCDRARYDWWEAFVDTVFDHIAWLQREVAIQHESRRTNESLLHEWDRHRTEARRKAIELPIGVTQFPIPRHRQGK